MTRQSTEEGMKLPLRDVKELVVLNEWKRSLLALPASPLCVFKGRQMRSTARERKQAKKQTNLSHAHTRAQQRPSGDKHNTSILSSLPLSLPPVGICLMGLTGEQRGLAAT